MKIGFNLVSITFEPPLLGAACLVIVNQPRKNIRIGKRVTSER